MFFFPPPACNAIEIIQYLQKPKLECGVLVIKRVINVVFFPLFVPEMHAKYALALILALQGKATALK